MNYILPDYAYSILQKLNESGHQAFIVGGAVRDLIMGRQPKDWDVATNASPDTVLRLFNSTLSLGTKHGTVVVLLDGKQIEVTTFRKEGSYSDFRRPDDVVFVDDLYNDLSRRDFTINALAYHPKEGLKDYNCGFDDIKERVIRCVGNPDERFNQDALRMMRAVRFSCELNFQLEPATFTSICKNAHLICRISNERIRDELNKILISSSPSQGVNLLNETGLLSYILPELVECKGLSQQNPHHKYDVYDHILKSLDNIKPELHLRLTMLMHDLGKAKTKTVDKFGIGHFYGHDAAGEKIAEVILRRLKYDRKISKRILFLIKRHDYRFNSDRLSVKKALNKIGTDNFKDYICVRKADIKAQNPSFMVENLNCINEISKLYRDILRMKEPLALRDLKIDGDILIDLGIAPGSKIKLTLDYLMQRVLEDPQSNETSILKHLALKYNE